MFSRVKLNVWLRLLVLASNVEAFTTFRQTLKFSSSNSMSFGAVSIAIKTTDTGTVSKQSFACCLLVAGLLLDLLFNPEDENNMLPETSDDFQPRR
jgi:hypothetical protein